MRTETAALADREEEIRAIAAALDVAIAGAGQFLLVSGGAGGGKSALLLGAAACGRERGFRVLMARGNFPERDLPYGLLARLFEPALRQLTDDEMIRLFEFVPRAAALLGQTDLTDAGENATLEDIRALNKVLARLTSRWPLLIAIDDVQWADRPSLQWLATLPGRIEHMPILLLVSAGRGETEGIADLLDDLAYSCTQELTPGNLGFSATATTVARSLGTVPDREFVAACLEATDGNPALVTALAEAVRTQPDTAPGDLVIPSLASAANTRLRRLSPHALAVVRSIAVLAGNATVPRVTDLTGIDAASVGSVVMALRQLGVITVDGDRLRMTQPLLRNAMMNDYAFTSLQTVLAKAARLLREAGVELPSLAEHLLASPPIGEPWVVEVLREAASAALADGDPRAAVAYLGRAAAEPAGDVDRLALLMAMGIASMRFDVVAAQQYLVDAVRSGATEAAPVLADLLVINGGDARTIEGMAGLRVERRLWQLGQAGAPAAGRGVAAEAVAEMLRTGTAAQATELARGALDRALVAPEGLPACLNAAMVLMTVDELDEALRHANEAIAVTRRWHHEPFRAAALAVRSAVLRGLGRLEAAACDAREGLAVLSSCGARPTGTIAVLLRAHLTRVLVEMDEFEEAQSMLGDADLSSPSGWEEVCLLFARGLLQVQRGDVTAGIADLLLCGSTLDLWDMRNPAVVPWRSEAALALGIAGRHDQARTLADEEVALARHWGAAGPLAIALRAQGQVHEGETGLAALMESIALLERWPATIELVRGQIAVGRALREQGNAIEAREILHAAFNTAQDLRLTALAKRASAEIVNAGGRTRTAPRTGAAALTRAERRTVALAMEGKSNRAIAVELYVHQRTVEIHLTNSYRKLGIQRRDQLSTVLDQAG